MTRRVVFNAGGAKATFCRLYDYIAGAEPAPSARSAYVERIAAALRRLRRFPSAARKRDDCGPASARWASSGASPSPSLSEPDAVRILRVLYGGRDLEAAFDDDRSRRASAPPRA